ncbi:EAL domain-containing protein, partial [Acinetobacter baumannii]|nr:EAL domain-containing protein [Acinetobacter baumannii]
FIAILCFFSVWWYASSKGAVSCKGLLYLKDLPVDELKIDRGFIVDLKPGSKEEVILESIIHLAKKLGLTVTAEGVETQQQVEILTRLGCQQFQGYLLGMPVNVGQLIQSQGAHFV